MGDVREEKRPGSLAGRLIVAYTLTFLAVLALIALGLDALLDMNLPRHQVRWLLAAGSLTAALAGVGVITLVARRFVNPIREMTDAASAIAAGDFERRVPSEGSTELSGLGESVNRMAHELSARLEEAREDRRTRELILESMAEGVALVDSDGAIQYLNPTAARILGGDKPHSEPVVSHPLRRVANQTRLEGTVTEERFEVGHPARIIRASGVPVGQEGRTLIVLRDVTDTTRTDAIRRDFAAAASHELKTPVASIRAGAETLLETLSDDPEASRRFAEQLLRDADRLSRIVSDLLDLSRLESESLSMEVVSLETLAKEEAERIHDSAVRAGLSIEYRADRPVRVRGSARDLSLAVRNLLENAVQYTRPSGEIALTLSRQDENAVLSVEDNGIGIPSKDLPRIFERFYRVDPARSRDTGGTGLGLALVKHIAESHGGRVEAVSELGRGSIFRLIIPVAD